MDIIKYLALWPQIQAAFASVGVTITLEQALTVISLIEAILPKTSPPIPPVIPPPPLPVVPQPPTTVVPVWLTVVVNVPGAMVNIIQDDGKKDVRFTDGNGYCNFTVANKVQQTVTTTAVGYVTQSINITPIDDTNLSVTLIREVTQFAPIGDGTQSNPYIVMDPTKIPQQVRASLAFYGYPPNDQYWIDLASAVAPFSNGHWYHGWNAYWEKRAAPGDTGSADPNLGNKPAIHQ